MTVDTAAERRIVSDSGVPNEELPDDADIRRVGRCP